MTLFFVLSGLVLTLSLNRMTGTSTYIGSVFLSRRLIRLWLPILFMLASFAILFFATGWKIPGVQDSQYGLENLAPHAILLRSNINGVVWSLQAEAFAAPFILLAWLATRRWGQAFLWIATFLVAGMSFLTFPDRMLWELGFPRVRLFGNLHAFLAGMLIPGWIAFLSSRNLPRTIVPLYPVLGFLLLIGAGILVGTASKYILILQIIGAATLLTGTTMTMNASLSRFLELRVIRFFGRISYSFYLLHPLSLTVLWTHPNFFAAAIEAGIPIIVLWMASFLLSIALTTPIAMLSFRFVEVPSIALGRMLWSSGRLSFGAVGALSASRSQ